MLAAYSEQHPAVVIDLEDAISEDAARAVSLGTAELAVIGENTEAGALETFVCHVDELVLLLPKTHPLSSERKVSIEAALAYPIVGLGRATSLMRQVAAGAAAVGASMRIRVQVRSIDSMCRMVAAGLGVAILPRQGAAPHIASMGLKMTPLLGMNTERRLVLAMRSRERLSAPAQAFVELVGRYSARLSKPA